MIRFSANLGFLWTDRPLPEAIAAAARTGFAAVECHWPFATPATRLRTVLAEHGVPMISLNTRVGDRSAGDFGLAALPGRTPEARSAILEAVDYAAEVGARAVHVMAGCAQGAAARAVYLENLEHACAMAARRDLGVLIEALNPFDAPGYFLSNTAHAVEVIEAVDRPNLKLMFDCYHVGRAGGDVIAELEASWSHVGHIQFAGVPDRGPPDRGAVNYRAVFSAIAEKGWAQPLGAEYRVADPMSETFGWMEVLQPRAVACGGSSQALPRV